MSPEECLSALKEFLRKSGFNKERTEEISEKIDRHVRILVEWNRTHNLTGLKSYEDIFLRLVMDSLLFLKISNELHIRNGESFADLGSGAGFPGIPLSLCFRENPFLLIESRKKKASFLKFVAAELELRNVRVFSERAETLEIKAGRGELVPFKCILSKAAAEPLKVLEIAGRLVSADGSIVVWTKPKKSPELRLEMSLSERTAWNLKTATVEHLLFGEVKIETGFAIFQKGEAI